MESTATISAKGASGAGEIRDILSVGTRNAGVLKIVEAE
jgi:hypothetical protein